MTEPSQYFKGRTVQEQMNEVIGYVDARAEEVAAAKADDVLEPAEQAKDDAIAAKEAAEQARDTTLAALPQIQQDITDLKAEDVALDGRLDNVELRITTAEGNIVTIHGQITALQTADGQNVKLTGNQAITGVKTVPTEATGTRSQQIANSVKIGNELDNYSSMVRTSGNQIVAGKKTWASNETDYKGNWTHIRLLNDNIDLNEALPNDYNDAGNYSVRDKNGTSFATLRIVLFQNGTSLIQAVVRNSDGTYKYVDLARGSVI